MSYPDILNFKMVIEGTDIPMEHTIYGCVIIMNLVMYANVAIIMNFLIYHFDTSDQRKPQGHISHITPTTRRYLDIALWLGLCYIMILPWL